MSFITKMFGGGKKEKVQSTQESIQKLRETEELIMKKYEFLEKKIANEIVIAKNHGTKNKRMALLALKRKKRYEEQAEGMQNTLIKIENQREALENSTTNNEVLKVMTDASKALKGTHKDMNVDKVNDIMDDIIEQQDIATEISGAISSPVGGIDVDEDELLNELEELEQEALNEKLVNIQPVPVSKLSTPEKVPTMPSVPSTEPALSAGFYEHNLLNILRRQCLYYILNNTNTKIALQKENEDLKQLQEWAS